MKSLDFGDPGFWLALAAGMAILACFAFWLVTGARKR